jgi:hypothetical protein
MRSSPASQVPHLPLRLRRSCAGIQQVRSLDLSLLAGQQIEPCSRVWWWMQILLNRSCDEYQFRALVLSVEGHQIEPKPSFLLSTLEPQ